jgi:predicted transcriptional regulator
MTLRDKLKENYLSVGFLSRYLGLSRPTLNKFLDSPEEFKIKDFRRICKLIKVNQRKALSNYFKNQKNDKEI